mgnify:FL=1
MHDFKLVFSISPWLMLLLIPAIAISLIPHFRLSKKYRRTRNRITSLVLHLLVMFFSISVLAGLGISYRIPNEDNEIIYLVDVSDSEDYSKETRDDFIRNVLIESSFDNFKVGLVTFGYDPIYIAPITKDVNSVYEKYELSLENNLPDCTASNIAAALEFTKGLFENPTSAKIVLISDGKETDESAMKEIRSVSSMGIKVDTVCISSDFESDEIQVIGVNVPEYHIGVNENFSIGIQLYSKIEGTAYVTVTDNDKTIVDEEETTVSVGSQTFSYNHSYSELGIHKLNFSVSFSADAVTENNGYSSYMYLDVYNKILILERKAGESVALENMLKSDDFTEYLGSSDGFTVDVIELTDKDRIPATVDALCAYDQIILNNVSNQDFNDANDLINVDINSEDERIDLVQNIYEYVYERGGGLLTVGGNDDNGEQHSYLQSDLKGTLYQQMLPVEATGYTPPLGFIAIVDVSGSMSAEMNGGTALSWAKVGLKGILGSGAEDDTSCLTPRDYIGIQTLSSDFKEQTILPLTPRTRETLIKNAIDRIDEANSGTVFTSAIRRAAQELIGNKNIEKRHIVIISDGMAGDKEYIDAVKEYYEQNKITFSVIVINGSENSIKDMQKLVDAGHGNLYVFDGDNISEIGLKMREDINVPNIKDLDNDKDFYPVVYDDTSSLFNGVKYGRTEEDGEDTDVSRKSFNVKLGGFYAVKKRKEANTVLVGEYEVPIYAQWRFGEGSVGSFMSDLNGGEWSSAFMADANGRRFLSNVINNLMPLESVRPSGIDYTLTEDNYGNQLVIYTNLNEGERIEATITDLTGNGAPISLNDLTRTDDGMIIVKENLGAANNYQSCSFVVKKSGIYEILIKKVRADGTVVSSQTLYKAFSYSKEYARITDEDNETSNNLMNMLANRGNGSVIDNLEDTSDIFKTFVTSIEKKYDPSYLFITLAIIAFVADIAVRKFKFKWLHEIIAEIKEKKEDR